jgi:hypothetical protein
MAFIFAIQRYDPSPFYYFDEVDMNLDAVNSELLAKMIRKNARYAQFIQVSLRKITLKEAHNLYGVTQATPGQSEVIANFKLEDVREETDGPDADGAAKMAKARRDGVARRRARKVVAATVGVGDEVVMEADEPAGDDGGAYDGDDDGGDDGNGGADDDGNGGGVEDSGAFGEGSGSGSGDGTGHAHGGTARGDASGGSGSLSSAISGMIKVKAER